MTDWKMTLGANIIDGGVQFRVWAPTLENVRVVVADDHGERTLQMSIDADGIWSVVDEDAAAGSRYAFLPGSEPETPDVYSRSQPDGVHLRSEVIDPDAFDWTDHDWRGIDRDDAIIYELHVGTMTPEGTFQALAEQLPELKALGVTVIELMPVIECPGNRNWGYDGVYHFAPASYYGGTDGLKRFVNAAHQHGLAVILDVVYNHFGPEGNYTGRYSPYYLSETHTTDWGPALNWDGTHNAHVRQWAIDNVCYWVTEFHIDGFRFDATHAMVDDSDVHIVREIGERAREVAGDRTLLLYAEDGRHDIRRARPIESGGDGMDGTWADDFHHETRVFLTNDKNMWLASYGGTMLTIADTIQHGFGPTTRRLGDEFVTNESDSGAAFVVCIQNHDQVGNRPFGERLHHVINQDRYNVASAVLLFAPETPLLFMGQEFAASTPFCFFTDMPEALGQLVTEGRRREFAGFGAFGDVALRGSIPDPQSLETFERSKLRLSERETYAGVYELYRALIALRREELTSRDRNLGQADAVSAELLRIVRQTAGGELMLLANFGPETSLPVEDDWAIVLTTNEARFGGSADPVRIAAGTMTLPARTAVILRGR